MQFTATDAAPPPPRHPHLNQAVDIINWQQQRDATHASKQLLDERPTAGGAAAGVNAPHWQRLQQLDARQAAAAVCRQGQRWLLLLLLLARTAGVGLLSCERQQLLRCCVQGCQVEALPHHEALQQPHQLHLIEPAQLVSCSSQQQREEVARLQLPPAQQRKRGALQSPRGSQVQRGQGNTARQAKLALTHAPSHSHTPLPYLLKPSARSARAVGLHR
jgi:hypothetical protein